MHAMRRAVLIVGMVAGPGLAASPPPRTYEDPGACPFECCSYRAWTVERPTLLLQEPFPDAKKLLMLEPGRQVDGITGVVKVMRPGQLRVLRPYSSGVSGRSYHKDEIVHVYTPLGEGYFKVWIDGEMREEEATFMYQDLGGFDVCAEEGTCWGKRVRLPEYLWWVKVRTPDGVIGWSNQPDNFANKDACS